MEAGKKRFVAYKINHTGDDDDIADDNDDIAHEEDNYDQDKDNAATKQPTTDPSTLAGDEWTLDPTTYKEISAIMPNAAYDY